MQLIELFLPLYDNHHQKLPRELFEQTYEELITKFGGLTAYTRAPMQGFWQKENQKIVTDELIIYEIMDNKFSRKWWQDYCTRLEKRFKQDKLVIRTYPIELI